MLQQPLPMEITRLTPEETADHLQRVRRCLGEQVTILGHHYQRDEIIRWADFRGDSLKLSQLAAQHPESKYIVFCGVHFMAESADVLTTNEQTVILPNMSAGCSMADMANIRQVEAAWEDMATATDTRKIVPITYVNSTAAIKAFVGRNGGACCTSSNAKQVIEWALERGDKLFFLPDQHLGRNTSTALGLDPETDMLLWNPHLPFGGTTPEALRDKKVILWKGHCSVHARFTVDQILEARQKHPNVQIIVHPECSLEVVQAADKYGSTEHILKVIHEAEAGSVWGVGTEINLVNRMAQENPDKTIFCLDPIVCPCSTMYRVHPHYLLWVLENLEQGKVVNAVRVAPEIAAEARTALERMLTIC